MRFSAVVFLLLLATGCASSHSFDVSIRNATDEPLTIGLVKYGPPMEPKWASPEDVAIGSATRQITRWGGLLPPEKMVMIHQDGHFGRGARAFARIYAGDRTLSELLATGQHDPSRLDMPLAPGDNSFVVSYKAGKLVAQRINPTASP